MFGNISSSLCFAKILFGLQWDHRLVYATNVVNSLPLQFEKPEEQKPGYLPLWQLCKATAALCR